MAVGTRATWSRRVALAAAAAAGVVGLVDRPVLVVGFVVCAMVFIPLEQLLPLVPRAGLRRSAWIDVAHTFGNRIPVTLGVGVVLAWTAPAARAAFPADVREAVLSTPTWVQFVLLLLVTDLVNYWAHRALHEVPVLWRLHAVHHSSEELDWLSTSRGHPLDQILNVAAITLPLHVVGFRLELSGAFLAFQFFYPFLAHANTTITLRRLSPLFVTPVFHHWHHAREPEAVNTNYGTVFSFWDRLFGTWHLPDRLPRAYGIDQPVPQDWMGQIVEPFRPPPPPAAPPVDLAAELDRRTTPRPVGPGVRSSPPPRRDRAPRAPRSGPGPGGGAPRPARAGRTGRAVGAGRGVRPPAGSPADGAGR